MEGTTFDQLPDILKPAEVMRVLRIGRSTLYDRLRDGTIPSIQLGRKRLVSKAALRQLFDGVTQS